jgi:hypothetical protein
MCLQQRLEQDGFAGQLVFSGDTTFRVCGNVNRHSVRIWGTDNPLAAVEHVRDSPQVNMLFAVCSYKFYVPFFFAEPIITGISYLGILQLWLLPRLQEERQDFSFEQDGAPPHFHFDVRAHLCANLPSRWIGRASDIDCALLP